MYKKYNFKNIFLSDAMVPLQIYNTTSKMRKKGTKNRK